MKVSHQPFAKKTFTNEEVASYLKQKGVVRWVKLGDLLNDEYDACVDGRETSPVVGNPGGDVSRLAEAVIAVGAVAGRHFNPGEILKIFDWYLSHVGRFYMHTDEHAMHHLAEFLNEGYGAKRMGGKKFHTPAEMYNFVTNPDPRLQVFLSRYLLDPRFVGCGHMKLMMTKPEQYGMSEKVLRSLSVAFFDTMWNVPERSKLLAYPMLPGDHKEGAVVSIVIPDEELTEKTMVPMVAPTDGKISIFVNHPQVVQFLNKKVAYLLAKEGGSVIKDLAVDPDAVVAHMEHLQGEGVRQTVSALAWGLPVYTFEMSQ
ncbi:MAG: hypothetical protein E6P95_03120 [Candidatus Moraniibacteriota bacterium]|nr:MAG: hypothetical protein E6P95_03120 [Candidatus Moranbacteria bacterium]